MPEKYNEIVMLVHPLYDLLYSPKKYNLNFTYSDIYGLTHEEKLKRTKQAIDTLLKNERAKAQFQETIGIYKKEIERIAKKPNILFLVIGPEENYNSPISQIYEELMSGFYKSARNKLGERFVLNKYGLEKNGLFMDLSYYNKLDKRINIKAFGEYADACVKSWQNKLEVNLKKKGKIINRSQIVRGKSIIGSDRSSSLISNIKKISENHPAKRKPTTIKARRVV